MKTGNCATPLQRVLRAGQTLAFLGLALQLIGIAWDGVLHYLDESLAGRESVFTLSNPSHLLLAVGLALTVVGVSLTFFGSGWGELRSRREAAAATMVLALLGAGVGAVAILTGGLSAFRTDHHGSAATFDGAPEIETVLREEGTRAAIDRLRDLAERRPDIEVHAHQIIHDIGSASFSLNRDISQTFEECTQDFQSGCYHGAIEAYSSATGSLGPEDVRTLCDFATSRPGSSRIMRFECLHGLGHGLTSHLGHDIIDSLYHCDYLEGQWDRRACYGGVFMENIIFWSLPMDDGAHRHVTEDHAAFVKEDDPHYPCNVLAEDYVTACYKMQTSIILRLNGFDFSAAFRECDEAPLAHRVTCYESMGRDISSYTSRGGGRVAEAVPSRNER